MAYFAQFILTLLKRHLEKSRQQAHGYLSVNTCGYGFRVNPKRYYCDTQESLKRHLMAFLLAYNFQRPLKALKFKSPYDIILEKYKQLPGLFNCNPIQKTMGLNKERDAHSCRKRPGCASLSRTYS